MAKIAIVTYSGLGNILHITPCIKALKSMGYEVHLFTWERSAPILKGWKLLDGLHIDKMQSIGLEQIKNKDTFDYLFIPAVGGVATQELIQRSKNIERQSIKVWGKHESEYMMDFAYKLGYNGEMPKAHVQINQCNIDNAKNILKSIGLCDE